MTIDNQNEDAAFSDSICTCKQCDHMRS